MKKQLVCCRQDWDNKGDRGYALLVYWYSDFVSGRQRVHLGCVTWSKKVEKNMEQF